MTERRPVRPGDVLVTVGVPDGPRFVVERVDEARVWYVEGGYDYFCHGLHDRMHADGTEIENSVPFDGD
jgi:hypothetical protein